jgi:hypothetical protein
MPIDGKGAVLREKLVCLPQTHSNFIIGAGIRRPRVAKVAGAVIMDQHVSLDGMTRLLDAIRIAERSALMNGDDAAASALDDISAELSAGVQPRVDLVPLHPSVGDP